MKEAKRRQNLKSPSFREIALLLPEKRPRMTKRQVNDVRKVLGLSQPVFARLLGLSPAVVKAWEQGYSEPNGAAARLLQIACMNPKKFPAMILKAAGCDFKTLADTLKKR